VSHSADPPRNFSLPAEERIRALTIGVPAWSARKRRIEDIQEGFVAKLVARFDAGCAKGESEDDAHAAMGCLCRALDLGKLRSLIADHNRWFPVEANLPVDPATSEYVVRGRKWLPEPEPTHAAILACAEAIIASR
jgi:hypothetical protein